MFPKPRLQKPPKWTVCPTVAKILSTKPHAFSVSAHLDYHLGYYACSLKNVITSFFKVMGMSLSDTYKNAQPNFLNFCQGENEKLHNAASYRHMINLNRGDAKSLWAQRECEVPGTTMSTGDEKQDDKWPSLRGGWRTGLEFFLLRPAFEAARELSHVTQ